MAELLYPPNEEADHWWVISSTQLHDMLARAHAGEDPDALEIEAYANSDRTNFGDDD